MTVTIKDVAREAGVSPSTVSRVISGNSRISEETKRRVRKVMEEMGYHPNMNARSLVVKSTETIGLIMPRSAENTFLNPFFPEVLRGIGAAAQERGYSLLLSTGRDDGEKKETVVKMVQGKQVDGVILLNSRIRDPILAYLKKQRFPFVMVGRPLEKNITYVDNDNVTSAKEATRYLIEMGHRSIAFVGGNPEYTVTHDRLEGYKEALKEAGLLYHPSQVLSGDFLEEGAYEAVRALLSLGQRPTAFLVTDDLMALGVISALKEMGLNVPEDVSIVSFNNVFLARLSSPPLTTVDIEIFQLGYQAVQKLFERIHYPEIASSHTLIKTCLVERQSVRRLEK
ncbi:HTH-type transcriptional regulator MalR [[Clostridium] ultunense Esp]|nr:HTH-type transcriptional regulator MalR [[Clostridium] ultunense Esp]